MATSDIQSAASGGDPVFAPPRAAAPAEVGRWSDEVRDNLPSTADAAPPPLPFATLPVLPPLEAPGAGEPPKRTLADWLNDAPPWLLSAAVHLLMILALALFWVAGRPEPPLQLEAELIQAAGQQLDEQPLTVDAGGADADQQILTLDEQTPVDDPFATPPELAVDPLGAVPTTPLVATQIGLALDGRHEGHRQQLLAAYGGNAQSEAAVLAGLKWLAKQQRKDGSWSLMGPYPDGAGSENAAAATAMALLAFQGAGHTHQGGSFQTNVAKGLEYLLTQQDPHGNFFQTGKQNQWFYTQGQATIAVCELYGLTKDPALRERAERAVAFCLSAQDAAGGWRYTPGGDSDVSVTGWILMALQSARMAGLEVPQDALYRIGDFLDLAAHEDGSRYSYQPEMAPTETMTAEALLCRQYLGWKADDPRLLAGVQWLSTGDRLPSWKDRNVYYWYYATQMLHHLGGEPWERWNPLVRDLLTAHQERGAKNGGSWSPLTPEPDRWGYHGGRLYVTCLSLYVLEVYYRHLPLYAQPSAPPADN